MTPLDITRDVVSAKKEKLEATHDDCHPLYCYLKTVKKIRLKSKRNFLRIAEGGGKNPGLQRNTLNPDIYNKGQRKSPELNFVENCVNW